MKMIKFNEIGRSMVEMLGVLAIIGVLSVGAIAGYSKAMMKYKMNKFAVSMNSLINSAIQFSRQINPNANGTTGAIYYTETFMEAGFAPDGFSYRDEDKKHLIDMFDNSIWFYHNSAGYGLGYGLHIQTAISDICMNIINIAKENSSQLAYILTDEWSEDDEIHKAKGYIYGDNYCWEGKMCLKDLTLNDIDVLCNNFNDTNTSRRLYIVWKE